MVGDSGKFLSTISCFLSRKNVFRFLRVIFWSRNGKTATIKQFLNLLFITIDYRICQVDRSNLRQNSNLRSRKQSSEISASETSSSETSSSAITFYERLLYVTLSNRNRLLLLSLIILITIVNCAIIAIIDYF